MKKIFNLGGIFAIVFLVLLLIYSINTNYVQAEVSSESSSSNTSLRDDGFYRVYQKWLKEYQKVSLDSPHRFGLDDVTKTESTTIKKIDSEDYLLIDKNTELTFTVSAPKKGLYEMGLKYALIDEFYTNPEIDLLINGKNQYNETSSIALEVKWDVDTLNKRYNRYGDMMLPLSSSNLGPYIYYFEDENESYSMNYYFLLEEGENEVSIYSSSHNLLINSLYLNSSEELLSYESYDLSKNSTTSEDIITIEAEDYVNKNTLSIKSSYYKDPKITPYSYKNTVLNILDGDASSDGGSIVTYQIEVLNSGYYYLAFKYLHDSNLGVVSSKNIYIDGSIPYLELQNYGFSTSKSWKNEILKDQEGEYLKIYLEKGLHTLSLETSLSYQEDFVDGLSDIMTWINSTSLDIKMITGGETSSVITQYITKYLPNLESDLKLYAEKLTTIYQELMALDSGVKNSAPELTSLNVAAKQFLKLAKNPNRINSKLKLFSDGSGSAYTLIGNAVTALSKGPIDIDTIYLVPTSINPKESLPRAKSNIFLRAFESIKSFFYSFSDKRYKLENSSDETTLNVWVEQSSLYTDIIQNMADEADLGFSVKINVLPSVQKLILSHSTGDNPDVVLSLDTWEPYQMALRGMLEDLSKYDDFKNTIKNIESGNFAPLIFEDGVFGVPETTSTFLLYYRKDVLESLNITVPNTWNEVIDMLYTLQSYSMNFYHPMSSDTSYKSFGMVTPFFFEYGAEVYSEDGSQSTLEDEKTLEAMKFLTELYTVYNLPQQVSSFFESFRSGTIPIGISSIDLYLQLQYAAPEISGQWGVTVIPGIEDDLGTVERWSASYGKCSVMFSNISALKKEEGWKFIKWWNETETQIQYMKEIKTTLGEKYLVVPANLEALSSSVWDEEIKDTIVRQAKWSMVPAVTPGSYIVEREISQIWNKVVIDKVPLRQAISESVPKINRELVRKLQEFNYIDSVTGKSTYRVPLSNTIDEWLGRN